MDSKIVERSKSYQTLTIEEHDVRIPIGDDVITTVASENEVHVDELRDSLGLQQLDLFRDGTRIGYVGYVLENEYGDIVDYTDEAVYLTVSNDMWKREFSWLSFDENVEQSIVDAHTREVDTVCELTNNDIEKMYDDGYVVGVDFPVRSVHEHREIHIDPYPIAERAEFLRFEVGISMLNSQVQALTEAMSIHSLDNERSVGVIADVLGVEERVVLDAQEELDVWKANTTQLLQDFAGVDPDESAFATTNVFERFASLN